MADDNDVSVEDMLDFAQESEKPKPLALAALTTDVEEGMNLKDYLEGDLIVTPPKDRGLSKPWMKFHHFNLVKSVEEVKALIDRILAHGRCALDLETEGFDNRIEWDAQGMPHTVHQIVGYCLSVRGVGYYLPVRHHYDEEMGERNPNLPVAAVEAEIKRLCLHSQPVLAPEVLAQDPFSPRVETPPKVRIYYWNAKFDQEFLYPVAGLELWHPESFEDGLLAAYSVYSDDPDLGLKGQAQRNLVIYDTVEGKEVAYPYIMIEFKELLASRKGAKGFYDFYPEDGSPEVLYACSDAICTELLCETQGIWEHAVEGAKYEYRNVVEPALAPRHYFTYRLEKQEVQAVRDMERQRAKIDKNAITELLGEAQKELELFHTKICDLAEKSGFKDFNPGSSAQLSDFLFSAAGLDIKPKPKINVASGQFKTDAATLEALAENPDAPPVLGWIVKYRQIDKVIGTYLTNMANNCDAQDQLRFKFNQTGAATGRFTAPSGEPDHGYSGVPIQGIPARNDPKKPAVAHSQRKVFVARPGYCIVKIDYAGQELRIVANLSGERLWLDEFLHGTGDLHTLTAKAFFGQHITKENKVERNSAKVANFSLIYGGGPQAIMRATKCDKMEASRRKANFDKSVPTFAGWVKGQHSSVKKNLGVVTAFKRFIAIPDANVQEGDLDAKGNAITAEDAKRVRAACERKATNFPIQGCNQAETLVTCKDGIHRIVDLASRDEPFQVWTGEKWANAIAKNMGPADLAEISLKDGTLIECDTRHKLLIVSDEGYQWIPFADLEPGMAVATPLCVPLKFESVPLPEVQERDKARGSFSVPPSKEKELWYWLGRYVGDGWLDPRGAIVYCFGGHEEQDVNRCLSFWRELGLNPSNPSRSESTHTPHTKVSTRYRVECWSVNLYDWLIQLGLQENATAHTKRLPARVFSESLEHRISFFRGMMDSDGHKPRLPLKVNGVWDPKAKGNPYNIHLCQKPLLVDLKRLLRTVGVESILRGPYRSGQNKQGGDTTSYRLDIQRRMFDQNVLGVTSAKRPTFQDMAAPKFLVRELLDKGPFTKDSFKGDESAYSLYLRLCAGGEVTVYTLRDLCSLLDVTLDSPLYGFRRIADIRTLPTTADTYTLSVSDPSHRFDADGVVTKNSGADILKISMVKLLKEFHKRGWRRQGGDDSVRMVLTVHDEIVFEIKPERLREALPVIIEIMESPSKMAKWEVPLVVEPLLGLSWDAKIEWGDLLSGKVSPPEWLAPYWDSDSPTPVLAPPPPEAKQPSLSTPTKVTASPLPSALPGAPKKGVMKTATFRLNATTHLTRESVKKTFREVSGSLDVNSDIFLRIVDSQGNVLVDPRKQRFPILPEKLRIRFQDANLGTGEYQLQDDPL